MLSDGLRNLERFRLLLGRPPELENPDAGDGTLDLRRFYRDKLRSDLEDLPLNREYAHFIDELTTFLQQEHVAVRFYGGPFLHGKAYLMPNVGIVGSSNFTPSGMTRRAELNLVEQKQAVVKDLRDNWFESMWAESTDSKDDLVEMLIESKFTGPRWTPFDVFMKFLYQYFQNPILPKPIQAPLALEL